MQYPSAGFVKELSYLYSGTSGSLATGLGLKSKKSLLSSDSSDA